MGDKTFNLTWNNHLANLSGLFEGLYKSGALTDTTLACQGGSLRAHRLVLAACSPFFERVFKEHYGDQPILILKSVTVEEMECLLDFMYRGSIDVSEDHLGSLIKTATDLEIRGLSGDCGSDIRSPYTRTQKGSENRRHSGEYQKENLTFQSNQSSRLNLLNAQIKMEEIEVEDDPMVMDSHESSFEQTLLSTEENKSTPTLYNRETRYKGQKRVAVGRPVRSSQDQSRSDSSDLKELNFNGTITDPTVPAIQMNEDEPDQDENVDSPRVEESTEEKSPIKITSVRGGNYGDSKPASKNQYKPFPCDLCTLSFTRASHLARHRRVHTGERPFACSICPRMFARQDKLKQHLDSHLQWPKQKSNEAKSQSASAPVPGKAKRGRPRKIQVSLEQSAMEEIMNFGEFSSMLNKSQAYNVKIEPSEGTTENTTPDNGQSTESAADVDNSEKAV